MRLSNRQVSKGSTPGGLSTPNMEGMSVISAAAASYVTSMPEALSDVYICTMEGLSLDKPAAMSVRVASNITKFTVDSRLTYSATLIQNGETVTRSATLPANSYKSYGLGEYDIPKSCNLEAGGIYVWVTGGTANRGYNVDVSIGPVIATLRDGWLTFQFNGVTPISGKAHKSVTDSIGGVLYPGSGESTYEWLDFSGSLLLKGTLS